MKQKLLPLILATSLVATPAPAVTSGAGDMARFMWLMMEMFAWMMGGNRSFGNIPYGGYGGLPTGLGSFPGSMGGLNPYTIAGLGALTGTGLPYNYSTWSGLPGAGGLGSLPYTGATGLYGNTYTPGLYGAYNHPYYGYTPYRAYPPRRAYRDKNTSQNDKQAKVVVQPVIIQPPAQSTQPLIVQPQGPSSGKLTTYPELGSDNLNPVVVSPPPVSIDIPVGSDPEPRGYGDNSNAYGPPSAPGGWQDPGRTSDAYSPDSLLGEWLGINGEYLIFEPDSFRMVDRETLTQGSYELKNGIMKARLAGQENPTYMQYHVRDDYLVFRTEDDQRMMFRRMGSQGHSEFR